MSTPSPTAQLAKPPVMNRNSLPTLTEVLMRKTRPPLDLYCFYIFLQQESNEDVLDFWLDVQQHENLCRAYFKDIRKSKLTIQSEWPQFYDHARQNGSIFSGVAGLNRDDDYTGDGGGGIGMGRATNEKTGLFGIGRGSGIGGDFGGGQKFERGYGYDGHDGEYRDDGRQEGDVFSDHAEAKMRERRDTESHGLMPSANVTGNSGSRPGTPTFIAHPQPAYTLNNAIPSGSSPRTPMFPTSAGHQSDFPNPQETPRQAAAGNNPNASNARSENGARAPSRSSFAGSIFGRGGLGLGSSTNANADGGGRGDLTGGGGGGQSVSKSERRRTASSRAPTIIPRNQAITKEDLVASGERIYARYLVPGAEKEVYLPPAIRIHDYPTMDPTSPHADPRVPDYYHEQKDWIFRSLEEDAFVRFLRAKAFSNLTRLSMFMCLILGLFALWAGWVVGFTLVFLDHQPKRARLYLIIPFLIAFYYLFSAYYSLSPLLVLLNRSETRPFKLIKVREPYVKKLLRGRAVWVTLMAVVATAIMEVIWYFPPGHRL